MKFQRVWWAVASILGSLAGCNGHGGGGFDTGGPMDAVTVDIVDVACPSPRAMCGSACVDLATDRENCGGCGTVCPSGYLCSAHACVLSCPAPEMACGTTCAQVNTDNSNCGSCGHACATGLVCSNGTCGLICGSTLMSCTTSPPDGGVADGSTPDTGGGVDGSATEGGTVDTGVADTGVADAGGATRYCANIQTDRRNCGGCGVTCGDGQVCAAGVCTTQCPLNQQYCGALCVTVTNDPANCGMCGHSCMGEVCTAGVCAATCNPGQMFCTDRCQDTTNDRTNCGGCGMTCPAGQVCSIGACAQVCPPDQMLCGSLCVNTQTDPTNCGTCGTTCGSGEICRAGVCSATCAPPTMACGTACTDVTTDVNNCGECGHACIAGQFCSGGSCGVMCAPGQTNCSGLCVQQAVDPNNCGACGVSCGPGYGCVAGACTPFVGTDASGCSPPSLMCGPSCTNILNDNTNCGMCGRACTPDRVCFRGSCLTPCSTGQIRCGTTCTDIRYDRNNCGACGTTCATNLSCVNGLCSTEPTFEVTNFGTTGCHETDVNSVAGFNQYSLGVSLTRVFDTGSMDTAAASGADVSGAVSIGTAYNGLVSDLQTGTVYAMLDATNTGPQEFLFGGAFTFSQLGALDGTTGALTATRISLSTPITFPSGTNSVGIFSGYGRMLVHTGTATGARWYHIRLPSGAVTPLSMSGVPTPAPETCGFSYTGIAEYHEGSYFALYTSQGPSFNVDRINRYRVSDGTVTNAAMFTNLNNTCAIAFSPVRNRWYFAHGFGSDQFTPAGMFPETTLGTCAGTFTTP